MIHETSQLSYKMVERNPTLGCGHPLAYLGTKMPLRLHSILLQAIKYVDWKYVQCLESKYKAMGLPLQEHQIPGPLSQDHRQEPSIPPTHLPVISVEQQPLK